MNQVSDVTLRGLLFEHNQVTLKGVGIALSIICTWGISLIFCLSIDLSRADYLSIGIYLLIQTFLCTGLFITAHDAMHRSIAPRFPGLNDRIGSLALFLYLFFPYKKLLKNHWLHHRHPATDQDPDFHDGQYTHPVLWYFNFVKRYFGWSQVLGILVVYGMATWLLRVPQTNLFLFWVLPSILSSLQLFYFGTFLPHRELPTGYENRHRTRSNSLPTLLSFFSCYHFGYHEEHHEYPSIPWWQLAAIRRIRLQEIASNRQI